MSPEQFARNLAKSENYDSVVLGVAIITRGLTDDDPARFKQGWPLNAETVRRAAQYIDVPTTLVDEHFVGEVIEKAPTLSDAILNKGAAR